MHRAFAILLVLLSSLHAKTIKWYCDPQSINLTSSGSPMDGSFRFELGVFKNGFAPTLSNTAQWSANWAPAQRASYNEDTKLFTRQYTVTNNQTPFTSGSAAYVWGFGGASGNEWILFRGANWLWPVSDPLDPVALEWDVSNANVAICGSINTSGSPFLMKTAVISGSAPPSTTYAQWQADELSGVTLNGPEDDADGDGIKNILEFVFGTDPTRRGSLPQTSVSIVHAGGQDYLQISVPRRADHAATLTFQVSTDLVTWQSGSSFTEVIESGASFLVVRRSSPLTAASPRAFMRMNAVAP